MAASRRGTGYRVHASGSTCRSMAASSASSVLSSGVPWTLDPGGPSSVLASGAAHPSAWTLDPPAWTLDPPAWTLDPGAEPRPTPSSLLASRTFGSRTFGSRMLRLPVVLRLPVALSAAAAAAAAAVAAAAAAFSASKCAAKAASCLANVSK